MKAIDTTALIDVFFDKVLILCLITQLRYKLTISTTRSQKLYR